MDFGDDVDDNEERKGKRDNVCAKVDLVGFPSIPCLTCLAFGVIGNTLSKVATCTRPVLQLEGGKLDARAGVASQRLSISLCLSTLCAHMCVCVCVCVQHVSTKAFPRADTLPLSVLALERVQAMEIAKCDGGDGDACRGQQQERRNMHGSSSLPLFSSLSLLSLSLSVVSIPMRFAFFKKEKNVVSRQTRRGIKGVRSVAQGSSLQSEAMEGVDTVNSTSKCSASVTFSPNLVKQVLAFVLTLDRELLCLLPCLPSTFHSKC